MILTALEFDHAMPALEVSFTCRTWWFPGVASEIPNKSVKQAIKVVKLVLKLVISTEPGIVREQRNFLSRPVALVG